MIADIFITLLFVALNGFFVAAEFAIVKVRASKLEVKIQEGSRLAGISKHMVDHLGAYLAATQLGITLASLGLGWIGEPIVSKIIIGLMHLVNINISVELSHQIALPLAFAVITSLHIIFGEQMPKIIAIQKSEKTTMVITIPLQFFYYIFRPFIWVLNGITNLFLKLLGFSNSTETEIHSSDELKYLVKQNKDSGGIETTDYDIIKNAFDFSDRTVKQVMVPRIQVVAIDINDFNDLDIEKVIEDGYSRIPCYADNMDNIAGVVYLKDILQTLRKSGKLNIREIMRPMLIVPETKPVKQLLKLFQRKHQQIAVVINEYGATEGIITMEDILEELVGEIQDEYDNETPFVEKIREKTYSVIATASLDDINEFLPHPIEKDEQYETLAGYIILNFGRIPNVNEKKIIGHYEFTVLKKLKNSILLVKLQEIEQS